eukprot:TRINITY_DN2269_c0_g1_i1.p2 TRINITY_DN2269_c0_g1~~TRINITY_DN2269_c0_g1_i1.p2  ORF type:complete len:109 (+),score=14.52 TRINITY_DN2269_c0_g1_i1:685-1011(+)
MEITFLAWGQNAAKNQVADLFDGVVDFILDLIDGDCNSEFCEGIKVSYKNLEQIDAPSKRAEDIYWQAVAEFEIPFLSRLPSPEPGTSSKNAFVSVAAVFSALAVFLL